MEFNFLQAVVSHDQPLEVLIGVHTIRAFVTAPKEFHIVGIVRMGMEFGLLAVTPAGHYVRVNGSHIERLDDSILKEAISFSLRNRRVDLNTGVKTNNMTRAPTVTFRKRIMTSRLKETRTSE